MQVELVRSIGVDPDRIVLANCCKRPRDIRTALKMGVNMTTFDTLCELDKMRMMHPDASMILRIRADDPDARCQLGNKYGAEPESIQSLLEVVPFVFCSLKLVEQKYYGSRMLLYCFDSFGSCAPTCNHKQCVSLGTVDQQS